MVHGRPLMRYLIQTWFSQNNFAEYLLVVLQRISFICSSSFFPLQIGFNIIGSKPLKSKHSHYQRSYKPRILIIRRETFPSCSVILNCSVDDKSKNYMFLINSQYKQQVPFFYICNHYCAQFFSFIKRTNMLNFIYLFMPIPHLLQKTT